MHQLVIGQAEGLDLVSFIRYDAPLWSFFAISLFFAIRYIPKLVEKHIDTLDKTCKTQTEIGQTFEKLSSKLDKHNDCVTKAMDAAPCVGRAIVAASSTESRDAVQSHVAEALDRLK